MCQTEKTGDVCPCSGLVCAGYSDIGTSTATISFPFAQSHSGFKLYLLLDLAFSLPSLVEFVTNGR